MADNNRTRAERVDADLYDQPGHLMRRANQISGAMYANIVSESITPIQYAILRMVHENPRIDQVSLARRVAIDTSTAALTSARLEKKGLLTREIHERDRRQLCLQLTGEGEVLIEGLVDNVHRMREALLGSLTKKEQEQFMRLLRKFVHLNNEQSRAPLTASPGRGSTAQTEDPVLGADEP